MPYYFENNSLGVINNNNNHQYEENKIHANGKVKLAKAKEINVLNNNDIFPNNNQINI